MKIIEIIDTVNADYPDCITHDEAVTWLRRLDKQIWDEVINTHQTHNRRRPKFEHYNINTDLIVEDTYAELYERYVKSKVALKLLEKERYAMESQVYNDLYISYQAYYNRHHMPKRVLPNYR